ncbi:Glycosyltransferase-like domain-containing protein 1,DNA-directed RNA polymerase II subunit RPB4,Glycosyltransferase-like domain-containing protein 1-like,DNA-directed RNA polymerase II subunit Rpb4 [Lepeophtheirus salmonis]|uniref:tRNA-queuosine alpha-mannosyltransferase n=1 Tax=Lepeophtheirus salmonis TaxID=72036 RepID=A0A7R8HCI6_LEPSM|nr:Glycosyltransferase-like domain-containing protein 1,DNA-directed RNA polymerase II subunit RPB4,Glycosyltransferase-like domain-containing protein 1-like,DNA-directed RNA polymerase II subunit Rpb4 [Lepeophtheirus salmonis]CAF3003129.1 Glycosyltransferase-like domain-containing protein 1,DNA-directed RNA polymerase II subunit RPB4,Glycosyltransferase-like domain-containing protein 1-like,DNA-directed RNA polymerase II subunit Rpb4 [Lepeophtheirus salmonis]
MASEQAGIEEDASDLQFPTEFEDPETKTLLISEVHILLEHRQKQNDAAEEEQEFSEVFMKTLNYTQRFAKFRNLDNIATLANLCPDSPEEARSLIPSLEGRFDDEELSVLLDDIQTKRSFHTSKILIIEPFYGGSHKQLIQFLESVVPVAYLATLTPKKWHWRARTGALALSQSIPSEKFTHLFASSVLNLAELIALRQDLNVILFNSEYNMLSFLDGIDGFLSKQPDYKIKNLKHQLQGKCSVLYFPVNFPSLNVQRELTPKSVRIVWPHRWEHDKNPTSFFNVLYRLHDEGHDFKISVLGETYTDVPRIFEEARLKLVDHIVNWGFVSSKDKYYQILINESDVVVSTANHEFFGVAVVEAAYLGCYPLVPNRLVYPELFPKKYLYSTDNQLYKRLREFCKKPHLTRQGIDMDFEKYSATDWNMITSIIIIISARGVQIVNANFLKVENIKSISGASTTLSPL